MPTLAARRAMLGAFAAILMAVALLPATPAPVAAAGGTGFVGMANGYRSDASLGGVAYHAVINQIAVERGRQIERAGELGHDFDYLRRRFDEEGICWRGFGEIVAYNGSGDFSAFGTQWFNSTTHRNIMLGDYTHASGSREEDDGRWYGVMVFVKICGAEPLPLTGGFTDIADSNFRDDIVWMAEEGITTGCSETKFCPDEFVHRDQMATFLRRAERLPTASHDWFTDDSTNPHQDSINRVADAGISRGCDDESVLPEESDHARPDGVLRGRRPEPAGDVARLLQRRQLVGARGRDQPDRGGRDHHRLRAGPLLPRPGRDSRPDGRVPPPGVRLIEGCR